jgi:hypothetical protein
MKYVFESELSQYTLEDVHPTCFEVIRFLQNKGVPVKGMYEVVTANYADFLKITRGVSANERIREYGFGVLWYRQIAGLAKLSDDADLRNLSLRLAENVDDMYLQMANKGMDDDEITESVQLITVGFEKNYGRDWLREVFSL